MNNKKTNQSIIFILLFFSFPLLAIGQKYVVYSVVGSVNYLQSGHYVKLTPRKHISSTTKLRIGQESAVTLLDEQNSKMYSLTNEGTYTVSQLIGKAKKRERNLSKKYMAYMMKMLFAKGSQNMSHPDTYMHATATSYRSENNDSSLLSSIYRITDAPNTYNMEKIICERNQIIDTDFDVKLEIVSYVSGQPIEDKVIGSTSSYVRVKNTSSIDLYVNVLNIDEHGNKYLVLPVDEEASCAHLFVPANSTVSFKSEPFIFSNNPSKETFFLVATEKPVDFSILMNPICKSEAQPNKIGIYRNFIDVKQ